MACNGKRLGSQAACMERVTPRHIIFAEIDDSVFADGGGAFAQLSFIYYFSALGIAQTESLVAGHQFGVNDSRFASISRITGHRIDDVARMRSPTAHRLRFSRFLSCDATDGYSRLSLHGQFETLESNGEAQRGHRVASQIGYFEVATIVTSVIEMHQVFAHRPVVAFA